MFFDTPLASPFGGLTDTLQRRNTLADWMFYDVGALSAAEFTLLSQETNLEGAILVVEPGDGSDSVRIQKFETFEAFRAEPGDLLRHFTIAGVGSSDVGAAALGRTLADHLDAPVGAIVAGYGLSDLLSEALGGWLFFRTSNQALDLARQIGDLFERSTPAPDERVGSSMRTAARGALSPDTFTLVRLLGEPERRIETLLGHSKGCLSLSFALQALAGRADRGDFDRARDIDVITTGAVVAFPDGLTRVRQYLGTLDWFGGMNSRPRLPYTEVPAAWHHLNTRLPLHMDLRRLLAEDFPR